MPEITVTDEQYDYLDDLRGELAAEHVGEYGHVRMLDALQYLIDAREGEVEDGSGALEEIRGVGSAKAEALREAGYGSVADVRQASEDELAEIEGIGDDLAAEIKADVGGERGTGDDGADRDEDGEGADPDDGGDRLSAMMNLLSAHEDKWEESAGEEGKYAVTLPDGGVEHVNTRDDVRAVLFEHYV